VSFKALKQDLKIRTLVGTGETRLKFNLPGFLQICWYYFDGMFFTALICGNGAIARLTCCFMKRILSDIRYISKDLDSNEFIHILYSPTCMSRKSCAAIPSPHSYVHEMLLSIRCEGSCCGIRISAMLAILTMQLFLHFFLSVLSKLFWFSAQPTINNSESVVGNNDLKHIVSPLIDCNSPIEHNLSLFVFKLK